MIYFSLGLALLSLVSSPSFGTKIHQNQKDTLTHVRSFSFDEQPESAPGTRAAEKRTVYKSLQEEFSVIMKENVKKAFKDFVGTVLEMPTDDGAFDDAGDSLVGILSVFQKYGGDIFKQLSKKTKNVKSSDFYQSIVSQNKDLVKEIIRSKKINKQNWMNLRDTKYRFFPSQKHYSTVEYAKDFFPDITGFTIIFVAGTIDLIFEGDVYKCELSKELDLLKNDVETSVQALIYKRLKMLEPQSSNWKWIDTSLLEGKDRINYADKYTNELLCKGEGCILSDGEGQNPVLNSIMSVAASVLDDANDLFDFFDRVSVLLVKEKAFCFDGCICPQEKEDVKIERSDYVKDFPWSCLGTPKGESDKSCKLPCGTYGENYEWCPTELKRRASPWEKCNKAQSDCIEGWYKK